MLFPTFASPAGAARFRGSIPIACSVTASRSDSTFARPCKDCAFIHRWIAWSTWPMQRTASLFAVLAVVALVSGCWRSAQPVTPSAQASAQRAPDAELPPEPGYRHVTLAFDVAGIGLFAASTLAYPQRGGDDPLAVGLLLAGGGAILATPVVHATRRHGARAGVSYLFRSLLMGAGMVVGMEVGCALGCRRRVRGRECV